MRRWHWALIAAVGVAALVGGVWWYYHGREAKTAAAQVRTATVTRGTLAVTVPGSGTFSPGREQEMLAPWEGIVKKVVEPGTVVAEGDPLAWMDDSDLRQQVEEAEQALETARLQLEEARLSAASQEQKAREELAQAESSLRTAELNLAAAQKELERSRTLYAAEAVSAAELEADEEAAEKAELAYADAKRTLEALAADQEVAEAQAGLTVRKAELAVQKAQSDLKELQADLEKSVIKAPFAGVVTSVAVEAGQEVQKNAQLLVLADTGTMLLTLQVDETDVPKVKAGQEVEVSLEAYPDESFRGSVLRVSPQAEQQNNISIFKIEVEVPNSEGKIHSGMTADGEIIVSREENVLLVPLAAVQRRGEEAVVMVMENGQPRPARVKLGADDGVNAVVTQGLQEGATVVLTTSAGTGAATTTSQAGSSRRQGVFLMGPGGPPPR
ncbi:MAG: efflux RND transporter periplasmic adaptor subunit [Clostridia bacterium]|jgi:HlyD family secretion protein|nr:efflux RND transporter periplasmic adaptor subunit [Clostridia bacterium]